MKQEKTKRCGIYTRVSSRNQLDGEYNSLETQRERLEAYVKSQGWIVHRLYEDGGFSGENLNRPGVQSLLADVRVGLLDCVVAYKIDRLTRSTKDFYMLVDCFEQYGVSFISVTQHLDTSSAMGRLLRNILMDFAQFEREMTSERTRDKTHQRSAKGYWNGGRTPFGYELVNGRLEPDSEEAPIVKRAFQLFLATGSIAKVRQEFSLQGITTRAGQPWGKPTIDHMLRNPIYAGKIRYRDKTYDGQHLPIVDEVIFSKAQEKHRSQQHVATRTKRTFLLKGLLKCADCGSVMTPHYAKKKTSDGFRLYFYYRCSRTMHLDNSICGIKQVSADQVEAAILGDIAELIGGSPALAEAIAGQNHGQEYQVENRKTELRQIRKRLSELEREAENYVGALGKGTLSINRLEKALADVENQKQILENRREEIEGEIQKAEIEIFDEQLIRANLRSFSATFAQLNDDEKPECLQTILKDVVVSKDTLQLNIFDLPGFNWESSKNRSNWLLR